MNTKPRSQWFRLSSSGWSPRTTSTAVGLLTWSNGTWGSGLCAPSTHNCCQTKQNLAKPKKTKNKITEHSMKTPQKQRRKNKTKNRKKQNNKKQTKTKNTQNKTINKTKTQMKTKQKTRKTKYTNKQTNTPQNPNSLSKFHIKIVFLEHIVLRELDSGSL